MGVIPFNATTDQQYLHFQLSQTRDDCNAVPVSIYSQHVAAGRIAQDGCSPFCANHIVKGHLVSKDVSESTYHIHCSDDYQLCQDLLIFISTTSLLTEDKSVQLCEVTQSYPWDTYIYDSEFEVV